MGKASKIGLRDAIGLARRLGAKAEISSIVITERLLFPITRSDVSFKSRWCEEKSPAREAREREGGRKVFPRTHAAEQPLLSDAFRF